MVSDPPWTSLTLEASYRISRTRKGLFFKKSVQNHHRCDLYNLTAVESVDIVRNAPCWNKIWTSNGDGI